MSGFLRHLVQRSLSAAADVRPRPASVFEPVQPSVLDSSSIESRDVAHGDSIGVAMRTDRPVSVRAPGLAGATRLAGPSANATVRSTEAEGALHRDIGPGSGALQAPAQDLRSAGSWLAGARFVRGNTRSSSITGPLQRAQRAANASLAGLASDTSPHAAARMSRHGLSEEDVADTATDARARHLHVEGRLAPQHVRIAATTGPDQPPSGLDGSIKPNQPHRADSLESPQRRRIVDPVVAADAAARNPLRHASMDASGVPRHATLTPRLAQAGHVAEPARMSSEKAPEPVVHVTIGRVEIRAVSAPPVPKRAAPSKPALSLSDYLDRRSGGRG